MKSAVAEIIGRKARGLKHCDKLIKLINEKGRTEVKLGNTGVTFTVEKGDYMHTLIKSTRSNLEHEINAIEITRGLKEPHVTHRAMPAPIGASDTPTNRTHVQLVCKHCGGTFTRTGNRQKYCSKRCRCEDYKAEKGSE